MDDNVNNYISDQFNTIKTYEALSAEFENWFKRLDYDQVQNKEWYTKIESAVINHLAKRNYCITGSAYSNGWNIKIEDESIDKHIYEDLKLISNLDKFEFKPVDTTKANTKEQCDAVLDNYEYNMSMIRQQLFSQTKGIDADWMNDIFNNELDKFKGQDKYDTPAKFVYRQVQNFAKKQEGKYYSTEPRWFKDTDSNKFRTQIFNIVKRLNSFETEAKRAFSNEKQFDITSKPEIDFWALIKSENFVSELEDYFKQGDNEREKHKLKKLFSYIPKNSIDATNLSKTNGNQNSFAWRNIVTKEDNNPIPKENRVTIFCSLVEFYGKDFFNKLPDEEKNFIREFYKDNPKFKLSDPSIIGNVGDKNKQNEILDSKIDEENVSNEKNEISITNNNIKFKSKQIKKSYKKARIGTVILEIFFVLSLILAWQISIYILIASAILLAILIIYLIALKKNGFECTKIFCCCMDVEDEPQKENSKDNNLSNLKLNKTEIRFK